MFIFNMLKIKEALPEAENLFLLFPPSDKTYHWGEDYYMQIVAELLAPNTGYSIISPSEICLNRSRRNINQAKKSGVSVNFFTGLDRSSLETLDPKHLYLMDCAYSILNRIIQDNFNSHDKHLENVKKCDLLKLHSKANFQEPIDNITISDIDTSECFIKRFKSKISSLELDDGFFRYYQQEAIKSICSTTSNASRLLLATGTGKTVIQCRLAQIAYHTMADNEAVVIVTSTRALVNQFYTDLVNFNRSEHSVKQQLAVPHTAIVKLSSDQDCLHVSTFLYNEKIINQKVIIIFCVKSFDITIKNNNEFFERVSLVLFDEYQEYQPTLTSIREIITENDDTLMIGCTATPHEEDNLIPAYSYTRLQAIKDGAIAPVVMDSLSVNYNASNLSKFILALPTILRNQPHPGFTGKNTLSELKGVIYLPSVEKCDLAKIQLEKAGIKCYCIHSRNPNYKNELRTFLNFNEPGVVLAVRMMRIGYDDKNLAWIIIAQKTLIRDFSKKCMIEQIIGRVMRKNNDKVGYVLGFQDTYQDFLLPLTRNQVLNYPLSMDYLASDLVYEVSKNGTSVYDSSNPNRLSTFRICSSKISTSNKKDLSKDTQSASIDSEALKSDEADIPLKEDTRSPLSEENELIEAIIERPLLYYYRSKNLNDNFTDFKRLYSDLKISGKQKMLYLK